MKSFGFGKLIFSWLSGVLQPLKWPTTTSWTDHPGKPLALPLTCRLTFQGSWFFLLIGITTIFLVQIHLLSTEFNFMVLLAAYSLLHQARQVAAGQENWLAEWRTVLGIIHR